MEQLFQCVESGLTKPGRRGGGDSIRRYSRLAGREGVFWRPFDRNQVGRLMLAAERFERAGRKPGSRIGPLGGVALEVLRELTRLIDYRTGRLDPAIATLQVRLRRSRKAVVQALKNLRSHGFLDWLRRYVPATGEGRVQVQQTSNAYRLSLPPRALRLLGHLGRPAPIPDDHSHRIEAAEADFKAQVATLPLDGQVYAVMGEGPLSDALARLGRAIETRKRS